MNLIILHACPLADYYDLGNVHAKIFKYTKLCAWYSRQQFITGLVMHIIS